MVEEYMKESRYLDDEECRDPDEIEDDSMILRIESTGLVKPTGLLHS
jgi:hypothetical protein